MTNSSKGGWTAAAFISVVELIEKFTYFGFAGNLVTYLTDNIGVSKANAAKQVNIWTGMAFIFTLFGASIADSCIGRFKAIVWACLLYFAGLVMLTLSVEIIPKHYRNAVFYTSLFMMALGEGSHRPSVQTFAADQFDENDPKQKKSISSFFNWWYISIVFGAGGAAITVIYVKEASGWTGAFGLLAGAMLLALVLFLSGTKKYKKEGPVGSPLSRLVQVFVAAVRKWRVNETHNSLGLCHDDETNSPSHDQNRGPTLTRTKQYRFLDKAMMIDAFDASTEQRNPWRLCTLTQVEEAKIVLRLLPVWLTNLMFATTVAQLTTFYTLQAGTMDRRIGKKQFVLPAVTLQIFEGITIIVSVILYDRFFIPFVRKFTNHHAGITVLQRIGVGQFLAIINMSIAALTEMRRIHVAKQHGLLDRPNVVVPMSIFWLLPQYMFSGVTDVFTVVGLQELGYAQMPDGMRSFGAATYITCMGIGSFLSSGIIAAVQGISSRYGDKWLGNNLNRAHLDDFYWVLAGLSALNFCLYLWVAKRFVYKKE